MTGWELGNRPGAGPQGWSNTIPYEADTWGTFERVRCLASNARSGNYCLYSNIEYDDETGWAGMTFAARDEFWLRTGFRYSSTDTRSYTNAIVTWVDADGDEVGSLRFNSNTRLLSIYAGASLLGTESAPASLPNATWKFIEVHWKTHASAGVAQVKVNGVQIISVTGANTDAAGEGQMTEIRFGPQKKASFWAPGDYYWDDCAADDSTWLGDGHVVLLRPDGNGALSDFTGSDGDQADNYQLVDEDPASEADYVKATGAGLKDTYSLQNGVVPGTAFVADLQVLAIARTLNVGQNALNGIMRVGGTNYDKTEQLLEESSGCTASSSRQIRQHRVRGRGRSLMWRRAELKRKRRRPPCRLRLQGREGLDG